MTPGKRRWSDMLRYHKHDLKKARDWNNNNPQLGQRFHVSVLEQHSAVKAYVRAVSHMAMLAATLATGSFVLDGPKLPREGLHYRTDVNNDGICDVVHYNERNWFGAAKPADFEITRITKGVTPGPWGVSTIGNIDTHEEEAQKQLTHPDSVPNCTLYGGMQ